MKNYKAVSILRGSLFAQNQELTLQSSLLVLACREVRFLCLQNKLVSSANNWKQKNFGAMVKVIILTRKGLVPDP